MSFPSKAKEAYMQWLESKGKIPPKEDVSNEWEGGMIDEDGGSNAQGWENFMEPHDTSGEPHTNDQREDEEPEEYSRGGKVKKMAFGGLAKALKMKRRA